MSPAYQVDVSVMMVLQTRCMVMMTDDADDDDDGVKMVMPAAYQVFVASESSISSAVLVKYAWGLQWTSPAVFFPLTSHRNWTLGGPGRMP
jgi:hypothetical protein